ncbi:ATP-dependent RNA helicase DBP9 [Pseudovirgaria hyperparasitica]|uniref:RNA helicase n=1 Tax=Pseudovirgaria hyperparasitica TaxID=470096 RepID=A0A6A6WBF8_9PEZI|nr:ATP-dependent RNA helicase DBP9 [Pseudovirgaria hyperparasitica]KAF2758937.1 ATP-dependent RNA helicase DBP9 [Pseudovirgaria hyperparasitica]
MSKRNLKRKLNESNVPEEAVSSGSKNPANQSFSDFGLDARILKGIQGQHPAWSKPTQVQSTVIPLALEGKNILARSGTGTGKTAAYVLPLMQAILKRKTASRATKCTSAVILVPSFELASQVTKVISTLAAGCGADIRVENIGRKEVDKVQRVRLADLPDIVVATPSRIISSLESSALSLSDVSHVVIDETDTIMAYEQGEYLKGISTNLPQGVQTILMSATLETGVDQVRDMFCQNPTVVELDNSEESADRVFQYVAKCAEDEKFLIAYVLFKLNLVKGKCIVFVADIDRCYRLKLFLEQFQIKSCILNSELPVNSRLHVVDEFNKGIYNIILATDEHDIVGDETKKQPKTEERPDGEGETHIGEPISGEKESDHPKKKTKTTKRDKEYGVARGIDFKDVGWVINFDLPITSKSYTHRIGRTARAGKAGTALSFAIPKDQYRKHKSTWIPSTEHDEEVLDKITRQQTKKGFEIKPFNLNMSQLDPFRYRFQSALRAVTRTAIREARTRELKQELLKSEKLKRHFEENPEDMQHLRHDSDLKAARVQPHLKHVPDYLLPPAARKALTSGDIGFVGFNKDEKRLRSSNIGNKRFGRRSGFKKKADPLKSFGGKGRR